MAFKSPFKIYGIERSFFSRKVWSIFRAMGVDHEFKFKTLSNTEWLEARAGTHLIPVVLTPEDWMIWDSTPIAFFLDERYPEKSIIPNTPVQKMACLLIEDWVDEWLVRVAVQSRWRYPENAFQVSNEFGINAVGKWIGEELTPEEVASARMVGDFATESFGPYALRGLGAVDQDEPIEAGFFHQLDVYNKIFSKQKFFFGDRISLADCALIGSFMSHMIGDPEPRRWVMERQPSVTKWVQDGWDTTVGTEKWAPNDELAPELFELFEEMNRENTKVMYATYEAMLKGEKNFEVDLGTGPVTFSTNPYREAARLYIRDEFLNLSASDQEKVKSVLGPTGVLDPYLLDPIPNFTHQSKKGSRHPD